MTNCIDYSDRVEIRNVDIMGETNWHWIKGDEGGFGHAGDGPMRDWIEGHSKKYFQYLKKQDVIITGGSSCGMHIRFYAKQFKHVIAFEPDPLSFYCMCLNAPYENVVKLNAALGRGHGMIGIVRNPKNVGSNIVTQPNEHYIPMMAIDSLNVHDCDLLQLDVEGYEMHVLEGAKNTIAKFKPVVICERFSNLDQQKFMDDLGYEMKDSSFMDTIYVPRS